MFDFEFSLYKTWHLHILTKNEIICLLIFKIGLLELKMNFANSQLVNQG